MDDTPSHPFNLPDDFPFAELGRAYGSGEYKIDEVAAEFDISRDTFLAIRKAAPKTWTKDGPNLWWDDLDDADEDLVEDINARTKAARVDRKAKRREKRDEARAAERWWRVEKELEKAAEVFAASGYEPPKPKLRLSSRAEKTGALVLNLQDLHIGLWGEGYVQNLQERFKQLVTETARLRDVTDALFVLGGDLVHADTAGGTTTKGTDLEMTMEPHEALAEAVRFVVWCVDYLRALGVDVQLVPVRGNHDRLMSCSAAVAVGQRFHETEGVDILFIEERQYVRYEDHLLVFTHGDLPKRAVRELPQTIQHEARTVIGQTNRTALFTGHLHHAKIVDKKGLIHYQCPTPVPADGYHVKEAFVGARKLIQAVVLTPCSGADQILHA